VCRRRSFCLHAERDAGAAAVQLQAHVAVDQGSGLVRRAILMPGNISDKVPFLALVHGDEQAVYAHKGV
jgi:IS5 family transposase